MAHPVFQIGTVHSFCNVVEVIGVDSLRVEVIGEELNTNLLQQPYDAVPERSSRGATGAPRELAHFSYRHGVVVFSSFF